jgi:glucose/arabinose dehydrogenase
LEAPWALDFAKDGSIWFTERAGRVRVIRNGQLLPAPAVKLNVVSSPGCEGGLLGLALSGGDAFLYYTYPGSGGNTNRVSRFAIQGDQLVNERMILDGIPGGTCYHFGGRIKFGPDGRLYVTTGEGFVASRAATPNGLSGKILSVNPDGGDLKVFAWGFRNPQGLAFDPQGRLYASNNGPTGDLGLCCHDTVDLVQEGKFYGWPAWAGNTQTRYGTGGLPAYTAPIAESGNTVWAPSGITFYSPAKTQRAALLIAELSGQAVRRLLIDAADPGKVVSQDIVVQGYGRLRDLEAGPDGCLYVLTSNRDGRGNPGGSDDRVLKLCPS